MKQLKLYFLMVLFVFLLFTSDVFVTRQPNWPQIFSGETITLTCEVWGGETTEWTCEWKRPWTVIHKTNSKEWTFIVSESSSGDYMCQCRKRDDWFSSTQWSEAFRLSVSSESSMFCLICGKLHTPISEQQVLELLTKARLNSNSREIPAGGSVTLTCTVTSSSSGWKYFWYKERDSSEPLTGEEADFPSNGQMNVSEEGLYWCRGGRGEPAYYTDYSDRISITKNGEFKVKTSDTFVEFSTNNEENRDITVRQGGIYRCNGVRGNPAFTSNPSRDVTIEITCEFFLENCLKPNL
uniref:Ig-like domain-containing protein n=1 Tax=Poecilia mexicana TaxID=48701 RepID=A0A3B3WTW7_9TELE